MITKRLIGILVFTAICCALIVTAGGGIAFVQRPVGVVYLVLWAAWWLLIAVGRQRGTPSTYERSQRTIVALGVLVLLGFVIAPPWEYAHLAGPLPRDGPLAWVGLMTFAGGIVLQAAAFWALRGLYTSRLGIQPGHRLVTGGPYRLVRHPGYLSNLLCLLGIGLSLSSLIGLGLALLTVPLVVLRIGREEEMLLNELGQAYQSYVERTRWRLIPYLY
jgi:protein-S-isoprenylcysteine O-methyltransferase Ste14